MIKKINIVLAILMIASTASFYTIRRITSLDVRVSSYSGSISYLQENGTLYKKDNMFTYVPYDMEMSIWEWKAVSKLEDYYIFKITKK